MRNCPSGSATGQTPLDMPVSRAILLGFPDTTQDADLYLDKQREAYNSLVPALHELGFELTETHYWRNKGGIRK